VNAQTEGTNQTGKVVRRRRKTPRHVPAVIERRESKPFMFGWGAHLTKLEREALKEKIALFGGIGIAVILLAILGWGLYQDNVVKPGEIAAANNKPIARVGNFTIRTGFFKAFEKFQQNQINNNLQQIQQQLNVYNAQPKKYAAQISQLTAQQNQLQQQLTSIPQDSLTGLLTSQTVLQRAKVVGIVDTPKDVAKAVKQTEARAGGHLHLLQAIIPAGLTYSDITWLITADDLSQKVSKKLAAQVPRTQIKVRSSHILVSAKNHSLAVSLFHRVLKGANFAALAKKYSIDTTSAKNGGDLGFQPASTYVKPFAQAVSTMKIGQLRLVKSKFGWHIVKLVARQRTRLTATEYSQAQQQAFNNWILKEQGIIGVTRFTAPTQLPAATSSTPTTTSPVTSVTSQPAVPQQQVPTQAPAPRSTTSQNGSKGKGKK